MCIGSSTRSEVRQFPRHEFANGCIQRLSYRDESAQLWVHGLAGPTLALLVALIPKPAQPSARGNVFLRHGEMLTTASEIGCQLNRNGAPRLHLVLLALAHSSSVAAMPHPCGHTGVAYFPQPYETFTPSTRLHRLLRPARVPLRIGSGSPRCVGPVQVDPDC